MVDTIAMIYLQSLDGFRLTYLIEGHFAMEVVTDGLHERRLVFCEVRELHNTTLALNEFDDSLSHSPLVEPILPLLGKGPESLCEVRQLDDLSGKGRLSIQEHLICIWRRVLYQILRTFPLCE